MTRVAISALTSVPGVTGGSETYLRSLCATLRRVGELDYTVFAPAIAPEVAEGLRSEIIDEYRTSRTLAGRIAAMTRASLFPAAIRRRFAAFEPDLIHFPLSVMVPPMRNVPVVTTVHDLQHEEHPQFFSRPELWYRRVVYGRTIRGSDVIIALSDHSRAVIMNRYDLPPERVRRIYSGVEHSVFFPSRGERGKFLLFPANRWPHKNHDRLFQALHIIRARRPELRLILTGSGHEGKSHPDGVEVRGRVPLMELVELYRTAAALVFPSLYEGFGLPVLEAMACGCPVAASNLTSLPEICGDAAVLFDPYSPSDIAGAVHRLLDRPDEYVRRGLARAAQFTWDECARAHERVYRETAALRRRLRS